MSTSSEDPLTEQQVFGERKDPLDKFSGFEFTVNGVHLGGSWIASPSESQAILLFAAEGQIQP
jgi:D-arabinose 1-dehydrogenase-like Zn-dependent alcohol dehydrogenase